MTDSNEDGRLERVRNILKAMDRSIDAARSRRLHEDGEEDEPVRIGRAHVEPEHEQPAAEARETRPTEPPRVPTSMFDRDGPRLKARPKRATT